MKLQFTIYVHLALLMTNVGRAAVVSDGKLGAGVVGNISGNYTIPASAGFLKGENLFHSFSEFNLLKGETATFGELSNVKNVLARVSGGASSIDGRISCDANLFLINPKGFLFGPNASLDVSGSFVVSSADYLKFTDGSKFSANSVSGEKDTLSAAPVSAFGFLGSTPGGVTFTGGVLNGASGKEFSLVAGDVTVDGAKLNVPSGYLSIASVREKGEVPTGASALSASSAAVVPKMGVVDFRSGATASIDGDKGGRLVIRGGKLMMSEKSGISAKHSGTSKGGSVDIQTTESVSVGDGQIHADSLASGEGGEISVKTKDLSILGNYEGGIYADNYGSGQGARIRLFADTLSIENGFVSAKALSLGAGGGVLIDVNEFVMKGYAGGISAQTFASGRGGNIEVISNKFTLDGAVYVAADTSSFGNAGDISVLSKDISILGYSGVYASTTATGGAGGIRLAGSSVKIENGFVETASKDGGTGNAGNIQIKADNFSLSGESKVSSSTEKDGVGGDISLIAKNVVIDGGGKKDQTFIKANTSGNGAGGSIVIRSEDFLLTGYAVISADSNGAGTGGDIEVAASRLIVGDITADSSKGGGYVNANSYGAGKGGDITLKSSDLKIGGYTGLFAVTHGAGSGGAIHIQPGEVSVLDGLATVTEKLPGKLSLDNGYIVGSVDKDASGTGGLIRIRTNELAITGYAGGISVETAGSGNGGDVLLSVNQMRMDGAGLYVSGRTSASGKGGLISLVGCRELSLLNYSGIYANTDGVGAAGDISLTADRMVLRNSYIQANTSAAGNAGKVTLIAAKSMEIDGRGTESVSGVSVSAAVGSTGFGGEINITTGNLALFGNKNAESGITARSGSFRPAGEISVTAAAVTLASGATVSSANTFSDQDPSRFGNAGSVHLTISGALRMASRSVITTEATQGDAGVLSVKMGTSLFMTGGSSLTASAPKGVGGNIEIKARDTIHLSQSGITATAKGHGGNIAIDPHFVIVDASELSAKSLGGGADGNLEIVSDFFFSSSSRVFATGVLKIESVDPKLANALGALNGQFTPISMQLQDRCAMRLDGEVSSFLVVGRGGVAFDSSMGAEESAVWKLKPSPSGTTR